MNSFQQFLLTFLIITVCVAVGPTIFMQVSPNVLYADYGLLNPRQASIARLVRNFAVVFFILITCMILFYFPSSGTWGYDDDKKDELEDIYNAILTSTNVWIGLGYLMFYKKDSSKKWWWQILFAGAFACLIVTCIYTVKLYKYIKDLTNAESPKTGGSYSHKIVWWIMRICIWTFVVWVCAIHTVLWTYHRYLHIKLGKPTLDN
tara:strand:- start:1770 stop:2384 length:615 start_codon:yes stop_codon:yes gene_type:complete